MKPIIVVISHVSTSSHGVRLKGSGRQGNELGEK